MKPMSSCRCSCHMFCSFCIHLFPYNVSLCLLLSLFPSFHWASHCLFLNNSLYKIAYKFAQFCYPRSLFCPDLKQFLLVIELSIGILFFSAGYRWRGKVSRLNDIVSLIVRIYCSSHTIASWKCTVAAFKFLFLYHSDFEVPTCGWLLFLFYTGLVSILKFVPLCLVTLRNLLVAVFNINSLHFYPQFWDSPHV